jgi:hypothetical protein
MIAMSEHSTPNPEDAFPYSNLQPQVEEAESKIIVDLLETRPYPLLHYTQPSVAAAALVEGVNSAASAQAAGNHILSDSAWQGTRTVSVTDLEGYAREQSLGPDDQSAVTALAAEALGMQDPSIEGSATPSRFWTRGGVCLLINPALQRHYGKDPVSDEHQTDPELLRLTNDGPGGTAGYGGGWTGEAAVVDGVEPQDIHGVLLSSEFTDSAIIESLEKKLASLGGIEAPTSYAHIFHDEINLLRTFGQLDPALKERILYMQAEDKRAINLHATITSPGSPANLLAVNPEKPPSEPDDPWATSDEDWAKYTTEVLSKQAAQQAELQAILDDPELAGSKAELLEALKTQLEPTLNRLDITNYSDLIIFLSKAQGVPVYDSAGKVIWPNGQDIQQAA